LKEKKIVEKDCMSICDHCSSQLHDK